MHTDLRYTLYHQYPDRDGSTFVRIFNCIIEEVAQRLLQATIIPVANNGSIGNLDD